MKKLSYISLVGSALLLMTAFQNCSKVTMSAVDDPSVGLTGLCTTSFQDVAGPVKILFLIDNSGSNFQDSKNPGTDPDKSWRLGVINKFLAAYPDRTSFSYNITTFSGSSARSLVNINQNGQTVYFSNDLSMGGPVDSAIQAFTSSTDSGLTPYKAALDKVHDIIQKDLALGGPPSNYSVVMLTDGKPTDYNDGANISALHQDVLDIVNLAPEQVSLNTVYYNNYQFSTEAENLLRSMAESVGRGTFVVANTNNSVIDIKDSIRIPTTSCP